MITEIYINNAGRKEERKIFWNICLINLHFLRGGTTELHRNLQQY